MGFAVRRFTYGFYLPGPILILVNNMCFKRPHSIYNLSGKTDSELYQIIARTNPADDQHCDAIEELDRIKRRRDFWSIKVVSWFALGLSIIAILISLRIIRPLG